MFQDLTQMIEPRQDSPQLISSFRRRFKGLSKLAMAIVFALALLPVSAWAKGAEINLRNPQAGIVSQSAEETTESNATTAREYATREAQAKGLEKFEGGSGTIWIGGSTVVIVLLVVLIAVLI